MFNPYVSTPKPASPPRKKLSDYGITGMRLDNPRECKMKCCIVKGPQGYATLFRIQPNTPPKAAVWPEIRFYNAVIAQEEWCQDKMLHPGYLEWFHNNEPQIQYNGPVKLFAIYALGAPRPTSVTVELANDICECLNNMQSNFTKTRVDEDNLFWLSTDADAVWSDVIGNHAAFEKMTTELKELPYEGFYEKHVHTIHSYFRKNTFTTELAKALHAPNTQVDPQFLHADADNETHHAVADDEENPLHDVPN